MAGAEELERALRWLVNAVEREVRHKEHPEIKSLNVRHALQEAHELLDRKS